MGCFYALHSLAKLFKENENEIKKYLKEQNFDFKNIEDIKKAVGYCSQYMQ